MGNTVQIAPSILAADYTRLGEEIRAVDTAGADLIHLDIMDGHFVPNISYGPDVVKALRPLTDLYFDVHLMLSNPMAYVPAFHQAGANNITIHAEVISDLAAALQEIKALGIDTGVSVNPQTPLSTIAEDAWPHIDHLLIMSVEPGFGGQSFIDITDKIAKAKKRRESDGLAFTIDVDGGINEATAPQVINAGADILIAGSAIFKAADYKTAIEGLRGEQG